MGWFSKITGGIKHGFDEAAEKAKEAAEAAARAAAAAAAATKRAAEAAAEKTKELAEAAAKEAKEAAEAAAAAAKEAADDTGNSFVHAANAASSAAVTAWTATSSEAKDVSSAVEKGGITIGNGFIQGATVVGKGVEEGAEEVGKGAVALAGYVSEHACSIGIGSALSAAFVALATDGEEEATVGSIAALAAKGFVKTAALKTAATALAFILVEPVYAIPGVSKSVGHKSELESAIAFLIVTACKAKPKLVVGSGGQYLAGALIYGITMLVCEGKLPGGFTVFKGGGLQGQIT
jgi:hypothetical protein